MRRPGAAGRFWPTPAQEALLRAALMPDGARVWQANRAAIDVDRLPGELHRLLPLIARTLAEANVEDPDLLRLRGVRQYTWYRNQRLFADAAAAVASLRDEGVDPLLIRGAATVLRTHGDVAMRPMNDLDLLIDANHVDIAERRFAAEGWAAVPAAASTRRTEAAVAMVNSDARRIVVHWQPTRNLPGTPQWWSKGRDVNLGGIDVGTLDPAAHLVQVIVDGAHALSGSTLRWVMDSVTLLRHDPPDPQQLVDIAGRLHVARLVAECLTYLGETFDAAVDTTLVGRLAAARGRTTRERLAHVLSGAEIPRLGRGPELIGRHLRRTAGAPASRALADLPRFLQGVVGVDAASALPGAVARKAVVALTGNGPDADDGPESSRP